MYVCMTMHLRMYGYGCMYMNKFMAICTMYICMVKEFSYRYHHNNYHHHRPGGTRTLDERTPSFSVIFLDAIREVLKSTFGRRPNVAELFTCARDRRACK